LSDTRDRSAMAAILLAVAGRVDEAQRRLERAERDYPPTFTFLRAVIIPEIRGAIDLARGKAAAVLVDMPPAPPYDSPVVSAVWVRGQALLALDRSTDAVAEFTKVIERGRNYPEELVPLSKLQIARAYVKGGETAKARTAYQDFLAAWKDADPDLPVVVAAKQEYDRIR